MYKLIPRYRPYRPPVPLVKAHFTVPRNDEERKKKLDKKKNKKNYFRKLVGLRRMGTAGSRLRGQVIVNVRTCNAISYFEKRLGRITWTPVS